MGKMIKSVRMSDIAQELGISTVTVSKALSGQKGVSEELRARIIKLADEKGYRSPASSHRGLPSYNIGIIISELYQDYYDSFYWMMYKEVAAQAMQKECFTMLEILTMEDEKKVTPLRLVTENKVDGLIVIGKLSDEYIHYLKNDIEIPVMFLDFYDKDVCSDAVISDGFYGMYLMTNYLFDHGHKRIAYVGTVLATDSITDRYMGYLKSILEHGGTLDDVIQIDDRKGDNMLYDSEGKAILRLPKVLPDAIVCNCDSTAAAVISQLDARGARVPEDVSVVGFDNYMVPNQIQIGLTTYGVEMSEMAQRGVNTLIRKISGNSYHKGIQIVEGRLVERNSVAYRK